MCARFGRLVLLYCRRHRTAAVCEQGYNSPYRIQMIIILPYIFTNISIYLVQQVIEKQNSHSKATNKQEKRSNFNPIASHLEIKTFGEIIIFPITRVN